MTSTNTPRRVALYGRASVVVDARSKSVDDQLAELRKWVEREGWRIVGEFRDDGISASRYAKGKRRPGWQRVMDTIADGEIDALLVWEVSRAGRDRMVFSQLALACIDGDVLLGTGGRLLDLADPDDGFTVDLGAALAIRESAVIGKRRKRASDSRAASGQMAPALPYGYRRVFDMHTGAVVGREPHPDQAPIVREVVQRLLGGQTAHSIATDLNRREVPTGTHTRWLARRLSYVVRLVPEDPAAIEVARRLGAGEQGREIAADLNARGVPCPVPSRWASGNLTRMVLRPTYAGLRVHQGKVLDEVEGTWPPLISLAEHYRLREIHDSPDRDKFRSSVGVRYLLSGIARCGRESCRGRMRIVGGSPGSARRPTYECRECHSLSRLQEPVDAMVERLVVARLAQPDVLAALAGPDDADVAAAADTVARLRRKVDELRDAYGAELITLADYRELRARIDPQLAAAERQARPRGLSDVLVDMAGPDAAAKWAAADLAAKRVVVDALVEVTILPLSRSRPRGFDPSSVRIEPRGVTVEQASGDSSV